MQSEQKIKDQVKERYASAITTGKSCCGDPAPDNFIPINRVVKSAGYRQDELRGIPSDAVVNSFGCGNPLGFANILPGETVVDIGSGAGIDCFLAAKKVGPSGHVIGIDMTPEMIAKARENVLKAGIQNVEFRTGEAEQMPVEDNSVDWIVSNCVINLSPDKPAVFREAFRVLRSGGHLSISDIMVEKLPWFLRHSKALYCSCVAGAIPEKQYLDGLRKAGFKDAAVTERIVYDRDQVLSLLQESRILKNARSILGKIALKIVDRYVTGQIWSARITASKP
jgi:SAM-dependent methyltransferase